MVLPAWLPVNLLRIALLVAALLVLSIGLAVGMEVVASRLEGRGGNSMEGSSSWPSDVPLPGLLQTLRSRVVARPEEAAAYRNLGLEQLQRARETADPGHYPRAEQSLRRALEINPRDAETMVGLGALALARHQFPDALAWGQKARAEAPSKPSVYGVLADALIELGRYEEGFDSIQQMVDRRPDLTSYARVSYARELQGDLPGAVDAMRRAVGAGASSGEQVAWARVQLGNLLLQTRALAEAEREYRWALAVHPGNVMAVAGLGRVQAASGDLSAAISFYEQAVERLPLPELVLTLGELYEAVGRTGEAESQFRLSRGLQALVAANGGNVDLELALFEAERGSPERALELARGEVQRRGSIHVYDALAWALFQVGNIPDAKNASRQALRLGSRDGLMLFHAGAIDWKLGDCASARNELARALEGNPTFSVRHAPSARRMLLEMEADARCR